MTLEQNSVYLSVIVPVYNSEGFLAKSLADLDRYIRELDHIVELIIVDDGSRDNSLSIARSFASQERHYSVRVIALGENRGKGAGVARGMLEAAGKYRVFLDSDLAYPPEQIGRILKALEEGNDVAVANRVMLGSRYTISPAFFRYLYTRHASSRALNFLLRHTLIPHCSDSQAGLKGFRAKAAKEIFSRQKIQGFPFDVEALFLAEKMHYRIREVAVDFRYLDEPTTVVFMQDSFGMAKDIAKIRLNHFLGRYFLPAGEGFKKLVVNADDFGMNLEVTRGIIRSAEGGMLKSASAMTTSEDFDESMKELARSRISIDIGFHANLTWGRPLLSPEKIPTLVGPTGEFLSKEKLILRAITKKINEDELYGELSAQIQKLSPHVKSITHIDGHHHVHVLPVVRKVTEKIAREFHVPFIRSPLEKSWAPERKSRARRAFVAMFAASKPAYWLSRGFFSSQHFAGFALGASPDLKKLWIDTLSRLPAGITEIMVHPGYESKASDSYNKKREDEISALTDIELISHAREAGVEFTSFRKLSESDHC